MEQESKMPPDDARWAAGIANAKQARRQQRVERHPNRQWSTEQTLYSVPRRFDIATLLTVSLVYSLLFTFLRLLDATWPVFAFVGGLTVVVGIVQPLFPYGSQPRWASAIAGMVYCILWCIVGCIVGGVVTRDLGIVVVMLFSSLLFGPLIGYLTGAIEAGVFLVADKVRQRWFAEAEEGERASNPLE